jgi:hypothetical protein
MSERVNSGPERTSNANTVQATMKPPAIQAKANMGPQLIGGSGRQITAMAGLTSKAGATLAPIT